MLSIKDTIASLKNAKIKNFQHLQKSRERKRQNVFLIEGLKEIEKAVKSGYIFKQVYFYSELISIEELSQLIPRSDETFQVNREVFEKIAYRDSTGGVVALVEPKTHEVSKLRLPKNPLLLVLEGVEKPGNLGAILRTADAAGVDAVVISDQTVDLYNPNAIRSSLGCTFTVPIVIGESTEVIQWLKNNGIAIYCTYLKAAKPYHETDFSIPSAIVMGTEATGITDQWVEAATQNIIIPMKGEADSMNVSTATAVVVFEACRQRGL